MGIFNYFFGKEKSKIDTYEPWELGLDLDAAINAHQNWKNRLELYLSENSTENLDPDIISCDDKCDLGKWIYSDKTSSIRNTEQYKILLAAHKKFHYSAGNIVILSRLGKKEQASSAFENEYKVISEKVVFILESMKRHTSF
ncbi:CZB domain-containing protein [Iodobacter sp. CM08]|uniref:CZB domain-containing protein n=1 Tax=Iodobacter sp. CM08 TaxID=3085902 RepID=UPI002980C8B7|nr:CZB domain-containing protein [Iodobacter sp. CM08]MDW5418288.1 CZB domain-containing protein [Iodobacter sp. CM08]